MTRKPGDLPSPYLNRVPGGVPRQRASPRGGAVSNNSEDPVATVLVCITCRAIWDAPGSSPRGPALAAATREALGDATDVRVQQVRCLANCTRGLSAALRRDGAWTYVFGHLDAERDGAALIAGARLLAASSDGLLPWRGRPDCLKRGLIARVPPGNFEGEV
jgi:predicted metal-binding protein